NTLLVVTYDEWGGFFEHVPPGLAPDVKAAYRRRGFRIPVVLVSPFARRGSVEHHVYDHTSVLKLIEWRHGLAPLSVRDARAHNLAGALRFGKPRLGAPSYDVPPVVPAACGPGGAAAAEDEWGELRALAERYGWPV